ncbi:MAG: glycoside hydrolase family 65 protein [Candidatus Bipolaricaulaceae bacterium]
MENVRFRDILEAIHTSRTWIICERAFNAGKLHQSETIFTIGNGYLGTRGTFEEGYPGDIPATLIHGLYDDAPIFHTELVNAPDWLPLELFIEGERFSLDRGQVLDYERWLDLHDGVLSRRVRWRSPKGHTVEVFVQRFASLADEHVLVIRYRVRALDFEGQVELRAGLNGDVKNPALVGHVQHWQLVAQGDLGSQGCFLHVRTMGTGIELIEAAYLNVEGVPASYSHVGHGGSSAVAAFFRLGPGKEATAVKLVSVYTSREAENPISAAQKKLGEAISRGYKALLAEHRAEWAKYWEASDVVIEGDDDAQLAIRFNLYHILIAAPRHDERVSIPARTLSGFGYRGHIFWDTDIFVLPFLTYTQPHLARNLLMYRYHTLPGARKNARETGYKGARYAWESALSGEETTPKWGLGPNGEWVRIWTGDLQLHISADVAYAVWQYWQATGDDDFFANYGAEVILETALFWESRVEYNVERGRYEIKDVIGPDEYHVHVNNSAFTNRMAVWNLEKAQEALAWLKEFHPQKALELVKGLELTEERLAHWADIIARMHIPRDPKSGLIEQFDGFFSLDDIKLEKCLSCQRSLEAILGFEKVGKSQVLKQPDVLMLLYLLGDEYDERTKRANWNYYEPRTDPYGSSLGPAIHAVMGCEVGDLDAAYRHFLRAVRLDLDDVWGNTALGIHAASAGAVWQAVVFGFAGLKITPQGLITRPRLPPRWRRLRFKVLYRGEPVEIDLKKGGDERGTETSADVFRRVHILTLRG